MCAMVHVFPSNWSVTLRTCSTRTLSIRRLRVRCLHRRRFHLHYRRFHFATVDPNLAYSSFHQPPFTSLLLLPSPISSHSVYFVVHRRLYAFAAAVSSAASIAEASIFTVSPLLLLAIVVHDLAFSIGLSAASLHRRCHCRHHVVALHMLCLSPSSSPYLPPPFSSLPPSSSAPPSHSAFVFYSPLWISSSSPRTHLHLLQSSAFAVLLYRRLCASNKAAKPPPFSPSPSPFPSGSPPSSPCNNTRTAPCHIPVLFNARRLWLPSTVNIHPSLAHVHLQGNTPSHRRLPLTQLLLSSSRPSESERGESRRGALVSLKSIYASL